MQKLFFEVFEALPRQGPGNLVCTRRALELCRQLPPAPQILDLGCGAGAQTLDLARLTAGSILAIDSHAPLVDRLRARLQDERLSGRVEARMADMGALDLPAESFDLVWSEGALYNLGLQRALPMCRELLRRGGYLAFTDAVWRSHDPPADVRAAFADYPTMGRVDDVLSQARKRGWSVVDHFDLPDDAWWHDFYGPMQERIDALRTHYARDPEALAALEEIADEPQMFRRSGHHYGYTFFILRRP
ncbi:MAG: methyltransferase domain-containing protein [Myxococcales bacterium]|jgi:SAM-dependent methyltransferase